jgi:large subunit ribosomal protein L21
MDKEKTTKKTTKKTKEKVEQPKEVVETFAVVEIGGTQLKVSEGKKYEVDHIEGDKGDKIVLDKVLLFVSEKEMILGKPYIAKGKVNAVIDSQKKGEKIKGLIYKAKSRYRKHYGHRSLITRLLIEKISV